MRLRVLIATVLLNLPALAAAGIELVAEIGGETSPAALGTGVAFVAIGRTLYTIDSRDPDAPVEIGRSAPVLAAPQDMAVAGSFLYVADDDAGLRVFDVSEPATPVEISALDTPGYARGVALAGGYAFVADDHAGLRIVDVSRPDAPVEAAVWNTPGFAYDVEVADGLAYVADGFFGLRIIDVSNPLAPQELGSYPTPHLAAAVHVDGDRVYVANQLDIVGVGGFRIIDVSDPGDPFELGFFDPPIGTDLPTDIAVVGSLAYVADREGLRIVDVSDPASPFEIAQYLLPGGARGVVLDGSTAWLSGTTTGLRAIDVGDPVQPSERGRFQLLGGVSDLAVQDAAVYVADTAGGLRIVDITDPAQPTLTGIGIDELTFDTLTAAGDRVYAGRGFDLYVLDVADPTNPDVMGSVFTGDLVNEIALRGDYAYLANEVEGLTVVDVSDPTVPIVVARSDDPGPIVDDAVGVVLRGRFAFIADGRLGLRVVDILNPLDPQHVTTLDIPSFGAEGITLGGNVVHLSGIGELSVGGGLASVYIGVPPNPLLVSRYDPPDSIRAIDRDGTVIWAGGEHPSVLLLDVSDPFAPTEIDRYGEMSTLADTAVVSEGLAHVGSSDCYTILRQTPGQGARVRGPGTRSEPAPDPPAAVVDGPLHSDGFRGFWPMFGRTAAQTGTTPLAGPSTANQVWQTSIGEFASPASPVVGPDRVVYIGGSPTGPNGSVTALDQDGTVRWTFPTAGDVNGTPAIGLDGTLYFGTSVAFHAVRADGTEKWQLPIGVGGASAVLSNTDRIFVGSFAGDLYAIDPDGRIVWTYPAGDTIGSAPALASDATVYVGSNDDFIYAITGLGMLDWRFRTQSPITGSPALAPDGTIYVGSTDRFLYAFSPDGTLLWRYRTEDTVSGAPSVGSDGTAYFGASDEYVYALHPDGTLRWRFWTGGFSKSKPAIARDGTAYIGVGHPDNALYAIAPDGTLRWRRPTTDGVGSSPALSAGRRLYFADDDGWLHALGPTTD